MIDFGIVLCAYTAMISCFQVQFVCCATVVDDVAVMFKILQIPQEWGLITIFLNAKIMLKTVEFARYKSFFSAVHLNN